MLHLAATTPTTSARPSAFHLAAMLGGAGLALYLLRHAAQVNQELNDALLTNTARNPVACQPGTNCAGRVTVMPVQTITAPRHLTPTRAVAHAQVSLTILGYDLGPSHVDGRLGRYTRAALQNFQRSRSLPVTGVLDPVTTDLLDRVYRGVA